MIQFIAPAALAALVLALGPLLIHLLQRRQANRTVVPTVRFVPRVSHSALRVRRPDELWLLALRTLALIAAVVALAGPILLTPARRSAWDGQTVRAVVVDTSASVDAAQAAEPMRAEIDSAYASRRIDASDLADGLRRAARWLLTAPPGRREVVVFSDFQHGALTEAHVATVPEGIGVRFVKAGTGAAQPADTSRGREIYDGTPHERQIVLNGWTTALRLTPTAGAEPRLRIEGTSPEAAARLERIARQAGIATGVTGATTIVRFGSSQAGGSADGSADARRAAARLLLNPSVGDVPFEAAASGDTLVVTTGVDPGSLDAATLVHASLGAWRDPDAHREFEPERIPQATLETWSRQPAPADASSWRHVDRSDARWFWLLSLLCLLTEGLVRRRSEVAREEQARAA